jgi:hypothetical protein
MYTSLRCIPGFSLFPRYKEKRLVIQTTQEEVAKLNSYHLRNQINDRFFQKENITEPVVATVTKSFTGLSIIITTMPGFTADFLIQKEAVWGELVSKIARKVEKDIHWSRIVVHGVPIEPFSVDEGLNLLKDEIETYNPQLKLMKKPSWLISEENRQYKKHASIVIAVENAKQANFALHNKLCIAGLWLKTQKYENSTEKTQCQNCQKWGHSTRLCRASATCQICAEKHTTYLHNCNICKTKGKECPHSILKCANCKENHKANSDICSFSKKQQRYQKYQQKASEKAFNLQNNATASSSNTRPRSSQMIGVVIPASTEQNEAKW